ncbi:MAG: LPS assembly protein LptD [Alphaproteobacteria bacterium]|nr:LPS assembly protein LptD [Alphaproteobacteria bacterium]
MQHVIILCVMLVAALLPERSWAGPTSFTPAPNTFKTVAMPKSPVVSDEKPVLLTADRIDYQQQEEVIIASGKVEIVQGETIVLCDRLVYDRKQEIVHVYGNVSITDETGNVVFAEEAELRDEMNQAVIEQFKARMNDESLFASARAVRVNENVLKLDHAVYSPCKVTCADDLEEGESKHSPMWQMRADHVTVDNEKQTVVYRNAWMELFGLPIFYTPYLSHATPGADGKSGITIPEFEHNDNLGNVYRLPIYYAIAPDKAASFTPVYTSREGPILLTEYKQKFDSGQLDINTSITRPRDRDAAGNLAPGRQLRGHVFAGGEFEEGDDTRWGFDIKRTTDDTYLRKYDIDGSTLLQSRVYGQTYNFTDSGTRSALSAEGVAFQGLAASDDSQRIPLALPLVNFDYETSPGIYGSRYFIDSNALVLSRDIGANTRRLSNTIGWRLPYITDNGQVIEFKTQLRGDIYEVSEVALNNGETFDGVTGRLVPEASALWRYPFINQMEVTSIMVEPVVSAAISPNGGNPEEISNEDSLVPEFTDTNLFSDNRFAGYDRIEHGPRVSYGVRSLVNYKKIYVDGLFGQHYRQQEDRNFPFSNDLSDKLSDYVGKLGLQYNPLYFAYRFRLDKESLSPRRREIDLQYSGKRLNIQTTYILLKNDPIFASREEIASRVALDVTKNWAVGASVRRDLQLNFLTNAGGELTFKNECVNISGVIDRIYTRDRDVEPDTKYLLRISLKNLN